MNINPLEVKYVFPTTLNVLSSSQVDLHTAEIHRHAVKQHTHTLRHSNKSFIKEKKIIHIKNVDMCQKVTAPVKHVHQVTGYVRRQKQICTASLNNKYRCQFNFFLFSTCFWNLILLFIYLNNNFNSFADFNLSGHNNLNPDHNIDIFNNSILYSNFSTILKNDYFLLDDNCCTKNEYTNAIRKETYSKKPVLGFMTFLVNQIILTISLSFLHKLLYFFSITTFIVTLWKKLYLLQNLKNITLQILKILETKMTCRVKTVTAFAGNFSVYFNFLIKFVLFFIFVVVSISLIIMLVNSFILNQLYSHQKFAEKIAGIYKDKHGTLDLQKNTFEKNNTFSRNKREHLRAFFRGFSLFTLFELPFSFVKMTIIRSFTDQYLKRFTQDVFLLFQRVLITNFLKFSSNLRLLFSKSEFKMKFKVRYKSNNMKFISIFCHCILIVICINYLIESRSIQLLEKRGTYRELRYVNKEHELSNHFLNNMQWYKYPNHLFYIIYNFFSVSFYFNPDFKISFYNGISNIYIFKFRFYNK